MTLEEGTECMAIPDHLYSIQPLDAPASHAVCWAPPGFRQAEETKLRLNTSRRWIFFLCQGS